MSKTLGLALGSGGARGVAHIGILVALEEAGIKPDYITGCSMGSVVGGCYAAGISPTQIRDIVLGLKPRDILDLSIGVVNRMAILRTKKMQDLLLSYLGDVSIEDLKIPFKCVATDLYAGRVHVFDKGSAAQAIQASSTIPGVFRPVEIDNMFLVDGGILCRIPIKLCKDMGADVVVAVDALENTFRPVEKIGNILDLLLRVFDIMDARQTAMRRMIEGNIADVMLKPVLEGTSQYVIKDLEATYAEGYELGKANVQKIKSLLED